MTIFVAVQAPELVSRDLRSHVLPLYYARPLRRADYPLAKFGALTAACLVMIEVPLLLLYAGTIASAHGGAAVWAQTRALLPGLGVGLMWSLLLAAVGLALASLSGRRAFAAGAVAGVPVPQLHARRHPDRVSAGGTSPGARVGGLFGPFTVLDGVRQWLGGTSPGLLPGVGGYGPAYGAMLFALLAASAGVARRALPGGGPVMTAIELRNISHWYGNVVAVNDITMTVTPGVTGLLGPDGAGKSTLLHMIAGFSSRRRAGSSPSAARPPGITRISTGCWASSPSGSRCIRF